MVLMGDAFAPKKSACALSVCSFFLMTCAHACGMPLEGHLFPRACLCSIAAPACVCFSPLRCSSRQGQGDPTQGALCGGLRPALLGVLRGLSFVQLCPRLSHVRALAVLFPLASLLVVVVPPVVVSALPHSHIPFFAVAFSRCSPTATASSESGSSSSSH